MQLYRGMDIGTAKLPVAERRGIPHHQLDVLDVTETATVARYQQDAAADVEAISAAGAVPIIVGGSMMYVQSLLDEWAFPATDPAVRARWEQRLAEIGAAALHDELARVRRRGRCVDPGHRRPTDRAGAGGGGADRPAVRGVGADHRRAALGHRHRRIGLGDRASRRAAGAAHRQDVHRRPRRRGARRCSSAACATVSPRRARWATPRSSPRSTQAAMRRRWPRRASGRSSEPAATCAGSGRGSAATTGSSGSTAPAADNVDAHAADMAARILIR